MEILKRDGQKQEFNREKIINAIVKAMTDDIENGLDFEMAVKIADEIEDEVCIYDGEIIFTVEDVQDLVEEMLMCYDRYATARKYIKYRYDHEKSRAKNDFLTNSIVEVVECKNIQNANANLDEYSFGGRKFESAGILHKKIALDEMIRDEVAEAHRMFRGYIHDLDAYSVGMHNCLFIDFQTLLGNGFTTRNGDVRPPKSISTAFQQVAVIFQCQSQVQFGGVGSVHIDVDIAPFVDMSFKKHFFDGIFFVEKMSISPESFMNCYNTISIDNKELQRDFPDAFEYAMVMTEREGLQSAQGLYHNLNTLESRAGSQLPFTSINFGRDISTQGRMISKWLLEASIDGIGKLKKTSIFPISIFQYKKGVNDRPGTPNYDLKQLAIKSLSKRIYPNIVNGDFTNHVEEPGNPDTYMATMGCRTMIGKDRFTGNCSKVGRGNITPYTINLPRIGLMHGIATGKRQAADLEGFWEELDEMLRIAETELVDRFYYICSQNPKSAPFMYKNGTMLGYKDVDKNVYEAMKHNTNAIGYIGLAEMCKALFGKDHSDDKDVAEFALSVLKYMYEYTVKASNRNNMNFSLYATPAENLCYKMATALRKEFGSIKDITDKDFITNSHHVPVWKKIDIFDKIDIEAPFCYYATAGCITYVEFDSKIVNNPKAIESVIDYAMDKNIPYLAVNFPIDTCLTCGYAGEIDEECPSCGGTIIEHLARVTGYLTTDVTNFNKGKQDEVRRRFKHSTMNWSDV